MSVAHEHGERARDVRELVDLLSPDDLETLRPIVERLLSGPPAEVPGTPSASAEIDLSWAGMFSGPPDLAEREEEYLDEGFGEPR